jgi:hypothetical protein
MIGSNAKGAQMTRSAIPALVLFALVGCGGMNLPSLDGNLAADQLSAGQSANQPDSAMAEQPGSVLPGTFTGDRDGLAPEDLPVIDSMREPAFDNGGDGDISQPDIDKTVPTTVVNPISGDPIPVDQFDFSNCRQISFGPASPFSVSINWKTFVATIGGISGVFSPDSYEDLWVGIQRDPTALSALGAMSATVVDRMTVSNIFSAAIVVIRVTPKGEQCRFTTIQLPVATICGSNGAARAVDTNCISTDDPIITW